MNPLQAHLTFSNQATDFSLQTDLAYQRVI